MEKQTTESAPPRLTQEFSLDAFADPSSVRDVVRGILHTIFFHRYYPTITPQTHEVLSLTLPYVAEPELETLIDQRTSLLVRDLSSQTTTAHAPATPTAPSSYAQSLPQQGKAALGAMLGAVVGVGSSSSSASGGGGGSGRGRVTVQFMEMPKAGRPRRTGMWGGGGGKGEGDCWERWTVRVTVAEPKTESERAKVRQATASTLHATIMKIITAVNKHKDHIPPITIAGEANPFPYAITVNQRSDGGGLMRGFGAIF